MSIFAVNIGSIPCQDHCCADISTPKFCTNWPLPNSALRFALAFSIFCSPVARYGPIFMGRIASQESIQKLVTSPAGSCGLSWRRFPRSMAYRCLVHVMSSTASPMTDRTSASGWQAILRVYSPPLLPSRTAWKAESRDIESTYHRPTKRPQDIQDRRFQICCSRRTISVSGHIRRAIGRQWIVAQCVVTHSCHCVQSHIRIALSWPSFSAPASGYVLNGLHVLLASLKSAHQDPRVHLDGSTLATS